MTDPTQKTKPAMYVNLADACDKLIHLEGYQNGKFFYRGKVPFDKALEYLRENSGPLTVVWYRTRDWSNMEPPSAERVELISNIAEADGKKIDVGLIPKKPLRARYQVSHEGFAERDE